MTTHTLDLDSPVVKSAAKTSVESSSVNKPNLFNKMIVKFKAKRQVKKVVRSLNEVKKIESGRKKAKSFDDFLKEL
jgi:hypothetical protein